MFGWRARIGYLCPSVFEMIAYDFYRIVPPGVGVIGVTCMVDPARSRTLRSVPTLSYRLAGGHQRDRVRFADSGRRSDVRDLDGF